MNESSITCDQAIFTSLRTPTGEGYRIVASSSGLKMDERREITRNSPSHEALCKSVSVSETIGSNTPTPASLETTCDQGYAIAFYAFSSGRFCVGLSLPAGVEHTGRGGHRVYTHVAVFDAQAFACSGYSPFTIARSMIDDGLAEPQLKPPTKLPPLVLSMPEAPTAWAPDFGSIGEMHRLDVLLPLLEQKVLVVHAPDRWVEAAEAWWLGIPGPLRTKISMSAGLKCASARPYHLQLLADEKGAAKKRITSSSATYVDTTSDAPPESMQTVDESAWTTFVRREWSQGDWDGLARRTSLPFADEGATGRQRVGILYNTLDELPSFEPIRLLDIASERLDRSPDCPIERSIVEELLNATQHTLQSRISRLSWPDDVPVWREVVRLWKRCERGTGFAQPLLGECLRAMSNVDPVGAAEAALEVAGETPASADRERMQTVIVEVLARWAEAFGRSTTTPSSVDDDNSDAPVIRTRGLVEQWKTHRPDCDIVKRVLDRCEQLLTHDCPTPG